MMGGRRRTKTLNGHRRRVLVRGTGGRSAAHTDAYRSTDDDTSVCTRKWSGCAPMLGRPRASGRCARRPAADASDWPAAHSNSGKQKKLAGVRLSRQGSASCGPIGEGELPDDRQTLVAKHRRRQRACPETRSTRTIAPDLASHCLAIRWTAARRSRRRRCNERLMCVRPFGEAQRALVGARTARTALRTCRVTLWKPHRARRARWKRMRRWRGCDCQHVGLS